MARERQPLGPLRVAAVTGLLLGMLGAALCAPQAHAQADRAERDRSREAWLNLRVYPLDVWGPEAGWGFGGGVVLHNAFRPGDQWLLTAAPALHETVGTLSYATGDPQRDAAYLLADVRARTTGRQPFYGTGPFTRDANRVDVDMADLWLRLRPSRWLRDRTVLVQPAASVRRHVVRSTSGSDGAPRLNSDGAQWGMQVGLRAAYDTRDRSRGATRGVFLRASYDYYAEVSSGDVQVDRVSADAYGFVPLGGSHRLVLRLQSDVATRRGDAPVPFYLLPRLGGRQVPGWDRDRFFGSDRLVASALYRFPLVTLQDVFVIGGHMGAHAASVYDDIGRQFAFDLDAGETVDPQDSRVPLRPALSTGVRLGPLFRDETYFDLALGVSPEGITGVRLQVVRTLDSVRPPHHNGATW